MVASASLRHSVPGLLPSVETRKHRPQGHWVLLDLVHLRRERPDHVDRQTWGPLHLLVHQLTNLPSQQKEPFRLQLALDTRDLEVVRLEAFAYLELEHWVPFQDLALYH